MTSRSSPNRGLPPRAATHAATIGERAALSSWLDVSGSMVSEWLVGLTKSPVLLDTMVPSVSASRPVRAGVIQRSCLHPRIAPTVPVTAPETRPKHVRLQVADASKTEYEAGFENIVA